ncbi:hypothetical protein RchiOBHm_Chr1g0329301 [Rosa chinensis]|uniref:Uncharacterized protein n=1 Tax=Rosa chinensis TaxID=74649 RepID=A0A2P6SAY9_ROSCH|nr:hypothetical protein RchiOBHm_Chr1g0329301 [Rosa chinensis]
MDILPVAVAVTAAAAVGIGETIDVRGSKIWREALSRVARGSKLN